MSETSEMMAEPDWLDGLDDPANWASEHGGNNHGSDWDLWPGDLRIREFPATEMAPAL